MRTPILVMLAALAAGAGAADALAGERAAAAVRAPAWVKLVSCDPEASSEGGEATFRGIMRTVPGTLEMRMRFTLVERMGSERPRRVSVPGLDVWRKSRTGVVRFAFNQVVKALAPGARYRVLVRYRWYGLYGERVRSAARRSHSCTVPEQS